LEIDEVLPELKNDKAAAEAVITIKDFSKLMDSKDQLKLLRQRQEDLKGMTNPHTEAFQVLEEKLRELIRGNKSLSELKDEKSEIERQTTIQNLDKLHEVKSQNKILSTKLADTKKAENPHYDALAELEKVTLDKIDYTEINDLTKTLEHQQFLYKLLTSRDSFIRKAFINENLPFLNRQLRGYLSHLPFKVEFTPELYAKITRFGSDVSDASLSNGQIASVNFALALAFRDVNQAIHEQINLCLLDEILDFGLDDETVELATKILKNKSKQEKTSMFLISHRGLSKTLFDNALLVTQDKDFSVIKSL